MRKKKGAFSKMIVGIVIAANILFASAVLYVFALTSSEPSALVASWFAFTTGELWSLAFIKNKKLKSTINKEKDDG